MTKEQDAREQERLRTVQWMELTQELQRLTFISKDLDVRLKALLKSLTT